MQKHHFILFSVITIIAIGVIFPSSYSEIEKSEDITCVNETISGGTFNSITILDNSLCLIQDVTVLKNIKVLNAQFVQIDNSVINGSIVIINTINGSNSIYNSTIGKNLIMIQSDNQNLIIHDSTFGKNLILKDQIIGNVEIDNIQIGEGLLIENSTLNGDFEMIDNTVLGNTHIKNNTGNELFALERNSFVENLRIFENNMDNANFEVTLNTINGTLIIKNNEFGDVEVSENIIEKNLRIFNNQVIAGIAMYDNAVNRNINTSNNHMSQFWMIDNTSNSEIRINNNTIDFSFICQNNLPAPILNGNIVAGQPFNECEVVGNP